MANIQSAKKRMRQSLEARDRNRAHRSRLRTAIKKLHKAVAGGDAEAARALLVPTISVIDRIAQKGVIHRNAAARTKSRLSRTVAAIGQ